MERDLMRCRAQKIRQSKSVVGSESTGLVESDDTRRLREVEFGVEETELGVSTPKLGFLFGRVMLWRSWLAKSLVKNGKNLMVEVPVITLRTEGGWGELADRK